MGISSSIKAMNKCRRIILEKLAIVENSIKRKKIYNFQFVLPSKWNMYVTPILPRYLWTWKKPVMTYYTSY